MKTPMQPERFIRSSSSGSRSRFMEICTSKTRAEILPLREELGVPDPYVSENGGAIYVPRNYFPFPLPAARKGADCDVLELGVSYAKLVQALDEAAVTSGVRVRGFSRMSDKEVAKLCGLPLGQDRRD